MRFSYGGETAFSADSAETKLHTPAQILKIMEQSKLTYTIDILDKKIARHDRDSTVLHNQYYIVNNNGKLELFEYTLNEKARNILEKAEQEFKEGNYQKALLFYKELYNMRPDYAYGLTLIGDAFFYLDQPDSAETYFLKAIAINPIDYTAHWFLADTYWKKGMGLEAINYITMAHLLNKNNPRLLGKLKYYRKQIQDPWEDWAFEPQYLLSSEGHKIHVEVNPDWMGYGLVKAVWKYEPGYAKSMVGLEPDEYTYNLTEEAEAVSALIIANPKMKRFEKIISDGYFEEFFYYEIIAVASPEALLVIPREKLERIAEYVSRFH